MGEMRRGETVSICQKHWTLVMGGTSTGHASKNTGAILVPPIGSK